MTPEEIRALAQARKNAQARKEPEYDHGAFIRQRAADARAQVLSGQAPEKQSWDDMSEMDRKAITALSGGALRANLVGDADPTTQNIGERIGSALNKAGEAMTFGLIGDEVSADPEFYRQQEAVMERDTPGLAIGSELSGALMGALLPGGTMGTLSRTANVWPRVAASSATGAAGAGTYGFMEGEGLEDRADGAKSGALIGAGLGALIPSVGAGFQKMADNTFLSNAVRRASKNAPSTQELRRLGDDLYKQVDDLGVEIKADTFNKTRQQIVDALRQKSAYSPRPGAQRAMPQTSGVVNDMALMADEMAASPSAAVPFKEIDGLRRQAGGAAANVSKPSDPRGGMVVIEGLDQMIDQLSPDDVVAGDARRLPELIGEARSVWAQMSKSQKIDNAIEAAGDYRYGFANGIKRQFQTILKNPKLSKSFSEADRAVMRRVANGSMPERLLETLGSGLTQVGGIIGAGLGLASGGLPGILAGGALTGASMMARGGANKIAERNAEIARALIASGRSPQLPVPTDTTRRIAESLMRRGVAADQQ